MTIAQPSTNTGTASDVVEASTAWTVPFGFTATAGRLLILTVGCRSTDPSSAVATPAGWSSDANRLEAGGVSPRLQIFRRVAAGGETSVALTKSTAIGFFGAIVDEYPIALTASPADLARLTDGAGVAVTTLTPAAATMGASTIVVAAVVLREGTESTGLTLSGESWYQRASFRVPPTGSTMLMATGAATLPIAESISGTWTWTTANRAVAATRSLFTVPAVPPGRPKVWNGSAHVLKPAKVWSGSAWVEKPAKVWSGSAWVLA